MNLKEDRMRIALAILSTVILSAALSAAAEPLQTWEQKQAEIKITAQMIVQMKEQIKLLEEAKLQAATTAEKAQIQSEIQAKEAELLQIQNQYQAMLANHTAYKYEFKDMNGDGINDNVAGSTDPNAKSYMYKNGYGYGYGFVDADGDGINDYFVDADGDGKCDMDAAMMKNRLQTREKVRGRSQHGDHGSEQGRDQLRGTK
jgi:hypothetical protein